MASEYYTALDRKFMTYCCKINTELVSKKFTRPLISKYTIKILLIYLDLYKYE